MKKEEKPKLLLHICCGPCATSVFRRLRCKYKVVGYFYNPNIHPHREYLLRLENVKKLSEIMGMYLITSGDYDIDRWFGLTSGLDKMAEGGQRCLICIKMRMERVAFYAKLNNFDCFTTTLSVSPYKDSAKIIELGKRIEKKYGIKFVAEDFEENNGYQDSVLLSKEYGLYRQKYCGCVFSKHRE